MHAKYINEVSGNVVSAVQLSKDNVGAVAFWCDGLRVEEIDAIDASKTFVALNVPTPSGWERVSEGDYVIMHNGFFYVAPQRMFEHRFKLMGDIEKPEAKPMFTDPFEGMTRFSDPNIEE